MMNINDKYFAFNEGVYLVKGAKEGAIYDIVRKKVYSMDGRVIKVFESAKDEKVRRIKDELIKKGIKESQLKEALMSFVDLGLGELYLEKQYRNNFKLYSAIEKDAYFKDRHKLRKLNLLTCEISRNCNLKCLHCFNNKTKVFNCSCRKNIDRGKKALTLNEWKDILKDASMFNCLRVRFIGGEPFLVKKRLFNLLSLCERLEIKSIEIFSNCTLLENKDIDVLKEKSVSIIVPFYSYETHIHDKITGKHGSFNAAMKNVIRMIKNKIDVRIFILIFKENQIILNDIKKYFNSLGLFCYYEYALPMVKENNANMVSNYCMESLYRKSSQFNSIDLEMFHQNKNWNNCWNEHIAIDCFGDVLPCIRAKDFVLGNTRKMTLRQVLREDKIDFYWKLSKDKIEVCKDCEFRYACTDCRVAAESYGGKIEAPNNFCKYNPYQGVWNTL